MEKAGKGIDSTFRNLGGLLAGYFTFNFAGNMVKQIAQVRGEFQQLEVAFETMLGNKERSDALMASWCKLASTTPFTLPGRWPQGAKSRFWPSASKPRDHPHAEIPGESPPGLRTHRTA